MSWKTILARSLTIATLIASISCLFVLQGSRAGIFPGGFRSFAGQFVTTYAWAFEIPLLAPFFARYPLGNRAWHHVAYYFAIGTAATFPPVFLHWLCVPPAPTPMFNSLLFQWM